MLYTANWRKKKKLGWCNTQLHNTPYQMINGECPQKYYFLFLRTTDLYFLTMPSHSDFKQEVNQQQHHRSIPKLYYGLWPIMISKLFFSFPSVGSLFQLDNTDRDFNRSGSNSQPYHLLTAWSWTNFLSSLYLRFSHYKWDNNAYLVGWPWRLNEKTVWGLTQGTYSRHVSRCYY